MSNGAVVTPKQCVFWTNDITAAAFAIAQGIIAVVEYPDRSAKIYKPHAFRAEGADYSILVGSHLPAGFVPDSSDDVIRAAKDAHSRTLAAARIPSGLSAASLSSARKKGGKRHSLKSQKGGFHCTRGLKNAARNAGASIDSNINEDCFVDLLQEVITPDNPAYSPSLFIDFFCYFIEYKPDKVVVDPTQPLTKANAKAQLAAFSTFIKDKDLAVNCYNILVPKERLSSAANHALERIAKEAYVYDDETNQSTVNAAYAAMSRADSENGLNEDLVLEYGKYILTKKTGGGKKFVEMITEGSKFLIEIQDIITILNRLEHSDLVAIRKTLDESLEDSDLEARVDLVPDVDRVRGALAGMGGALTFNQIWKNAFQTPTDALFFEYVKLLSACEDQYFTRPDYRSTFYAMDSTSFLSIGGHSNIEMTVFLNELIQYHNTTVDKKAFYDMFPYFTSLLKTKKEGEFILTEIKSYITTFYPKYEHVFLVTLKPSHVVMFDEIYAKVISISKTIIDALPADSDECARFLHQRFPLGHFSREYSNLMLAVEKTSVTPVKSQLPVKSLSYNTRTAKTINYRRQFPRAAAVAVAAVAAAAAAGGKRRTRKLRRRERR
jgi:hypothetical protein